MNDRDTVFLDQSEILRDFEGMNSTNYDPFQYPCVDDGPFVSAEKNCKLPQKNLEPSSIKLDQSNLNTNLPKNDVFTTCSNFDPNLSKSGIVIYKAEEISPETNQISRQQLEKPELREKCASRLSCSELTNFHEIEPTDYFIEHSGELKGIVVSSKTYRICLRENNQIVIKCPEIRYSDFEKFRECLNWFYPTTIFPKLPPKNIFKTQEIEDSRLNGLNFFIQETAKIAFNHKSNVKFLFSHFTNSQYFDENFFNISYLSNLNQHEDFSVLERPTIEIKRSTFSFKFLYAKNTQRKRDKIEFDIEEKEKQIVNLSSKLHEMVETIKKHHELLIKDSKATEGFSNDLLYLKDYKDKKKQYCSLYALYNSLKEMHLNLSSRTDHEYSSLHCEFENYLSMVDSLLEIFGVYRQFLEDYELVLSDQQNSLRSIEQKESIRKFKANFERDFLSQINTFEKNHAKTFPHMLNYYCSYIRKLYDKLIR